MNEDGWIYDVHQGLPSPSKCTDKSANSLVQGTYRYYHYVSDEIDDRGWGCGYRSLQTICSWLNINTELSNDVPSIKEIQTILVQLEDKPKSFVGSRDWIGSFEVCLVIDQLYKVPSKILHVESGSKLRDITDTLRQHFAKFGSPVMMGGDRDASSKGILGIHIGTGDSVYLLVLDPHFVGKCPTVELLQNDGWVKWQHLDDFNENSFYNLCLPQIAPST